MNLSKFSISLVFRIVSLYIYMNLKYKFYNDYLIFKTQDKIGLFHKLRGELVINPMFSKDKIILKYTNCSRLLYKLR